MDRTDLFLRWNIDKQYENTKRENAMVERLLLCMLLLMHIGEDLSRQTQRIWINGVEPIMVH